jgi:hypothetical protein
MAPAVIHFSRTLRPVINSINEFQAILDGGDPRMLTIDMSRHTSVKTLEALCCIPKVRLIGDVAFYYLMYVEAIALHSSNVRFVCLKRDREQTVASWMRKSSVPMLRSKRIAARLSSLITREPFLESRNFWMEHDGTRWMKDDVWDKCFPKFEGPSKVDAIRQYWDYYYDEAERLQSKLGDIFRVYPVEALSDRVQQAELLRFCGLPQDELVLGQVHLHKSGVSD